MAFAYLAADDLRGVQLNAGNRIVGKGHIHAIGVYIIHIVGGGNGNLGLAGLVACGLHNTVGVYLYTVVIAAPLDGAIHSGLGCHLGVQIHRVAVIPLSGRHLHAAERTGVRAVLVYKGHTGQADITAQLVESVQQFTGISITAVLGSHRLIIIDIISIVQLSAEVLI